MPDLQVTSRAVDTTVDFVVSAEYDSAGVSVPYSDASVAVSLRNTSHARYAGDVDAMYRVDSGDWVMLPAGSVKSLAIDLSSQTITIKRAQFSANASIRLIATGEPAGLYAGGVAVPGGTGSSSVGAEDHLQSSDGDGGFKDAGTVTDALADVGVPIPGSAALPEHSVPFVADGEFASSFQTQPPLGVDAVQPELAGAGAGNVNNGSHSYKITYTTLDLNGNPGETTGSSATLSVTVTDKTANGKVRIPDLADLIGILANPFISGANIYRNTIADPATYKLVGTYNDGDFIDNVADASLGAVIPSVSTAAYSAGPVINDPAIFGTNVPNTLLQGGIEAGSSNATPGSKLATGPTINIHIPGWNDAGGNPTGSPLVFQMTPAYGAAGARWLMTSDNFNFDFYGNLRVAKSLASAEVAFADLPASPVVGMIANVSNSSTNAWGATADGAGANHVQVRFNGSVWTVTGK